MSKSSRLFIYLLFAAFLGWKNEAFAQRFGSVGEAAAPATPKPAAQAQTNAKPQQNLPVSNINQAKEADEEDDIDTTPAAFQFKFVGNEVVTQNNPRIMLYMRDFKISRNINGIPNCNMRFYVLSTLDEKITNISYRLKWPNIETALSFDNVKPNSAMYFDYSLLGNGCYNMDKAPNIVVNRCRVKGMSQQDCANAIEWLN